MYVTGLAVSGLVYSVSQFFQDGEKRSELQIVEGYLREYVVVNPAAVDRWGVDIQFVDGDFSFTPKAPINHEERAAENQNSQHAGAENAV